MTKLGILTVFFFLYRRNYKTL